jgi:hypothetical protein
MVMYGSYPELRFRLPGEESGFACQATGSFVALAFGDVTIARLRRR